MLSKHLNIGIKLLLAGLFVHYLTYSDLPQYQNKGMSGRLIVYPLMVFLVAIIYWLVNARKTKKVSYPHWADFLITLAFTTDMLGNTLSLFDTIEWWDDFMHFVLWLSWVTAVGIILRMYTKLSPFIIALLIFGVGAIGSIIWELAEYSTFVTTNPSESLSAYRDTMGDELLSMSGGAAAALIIYLSTKLQTIKT